MLSVFYYLTIISFIMTFLIHFTGFRRHEIKIAFLGLIFNAGSLLLIIIQSGHFPGYTVFESFLFTVFTLGCLAILFPAIGGFASKIRMWAWSEILILLGISMFFPRSPGSTGFDYNYIFKVLFHAFRPLSLGIMLYSTGYFIQFILEREFNERTAWLSRMGRNFLITSVIAFLLSEYTGIIWCQQEFGDFWMWNKNFIQSTMIMSYFMLAFHIPGKGKRAEDFRALVGGLSAVFIITLTILRSIF